MFQVTSYFLNCRNQYFTFPKIDAMRDQLVLEKRILAVQEALCEFVVEQVINKKGEFYYDGVSNIDNTSKYDDIV